MLRTSWKVVAVSAGLYGAASGDEWKSPTTPVVAPVTKAEPVKHASAAGVVWRASSGVVPASHTAPTLAADPIWKASPAAPRVIETSEVAKQLEPGLIPAAAQIPIPVPVPVPSPSPLVLPDPKPQLPKPQVPNVPEVAPKPTPVAPMAAPLSVHAPTQAIPVAAPASDESTAVWGAYNQGPLPVAPVAVEAPTRHHTYGSAAVHLSRDYHFMDAFHKNGNNNREGASVLAAPLPVSKCFVEGEYLLWWVNNGDIPVLGTTSTDGGDGFLGQPGTVPLIGSGPFGQSQRSGFRLRAGTWLDDCHECGIDGSIFVLGSVGTSTGVNSDQFPIITRPFFAPNGGGQQFGEQVASPGLSTGALLVDQTSFLWGADLNYRRCCGEGEVFAGYRYLNLQETLTITEFVVAGAGAPIPQGTTIVVRDQFEVKNNFHGGQIGGLRGWQFGNWSLEARGSVALGVTTQNLRIAGAQARTQPGQTTQAILGGLLAVGPNIGAFENSEFSVVPEATLAVGYRVRPNLKLYCGYNFMAWTNVLRPGDSIDRVVNVSLVPQLIDPTVTVPPSTVQRPQPQFGQSTLYINGIQFGLEGSW